MKCDMQYTAICFNVKNYNEKQCFKLTTFFTVCAISFEAHLKNNLFRWTQQKLIYYTSCEESLEYITLWRFLRGSCWSFSTGAVLIVGVFWYTLTLQLYILIGEFNGSIFCWKSACWKNENVGFRILGSFGGMKCCLCEKGLMLQLSIALDIACYCFSCLLS